nr:TPA_inf: conotoxin precursor J [Conus judaeus]
MASVQSVTCCCLLWLMLSVQLVNPGSPGTAQRSGDRTPEQKLEFICPGICAEGAATGICDCTKKRVVDSSWIRRRKRSTV